MVLGLRSQPPKKLSPDCCEPLVCINNGSMQGQEFIICAVFSAQQFTVKAVLFIPAGWPTIDLQVWSMLPSLDRSISVAGI